jgi:hypothetical protein
VAPGSASVPCGSRLLPCRQELERRSSRLVADHRRHVARVAAVLLAVGSVDRVVDVLVDVHEDHVLIDAAGADMPRAPLLGGAEPAAAGPAPRADVEVVADADDPDRNRLAQRALAAASSDLQLLRRADAVKLVAGPCRAHGCTTTLIDSRSAIAR